MYEKSSVFDTDCIGRLLLKLALPAFVGLAVVTLYNVVDTVFIGHFAGSLSIAGIGIVAPVQAIAMGLGQAIGIGGGSIISRAIGAGDTQRAERALGNALAMVGLLTLAFAIICFVSPDFWLGLMGASENVLPYARDYLLIILLGLFFQNISLTLNALIMAEGNARVAMTGIVIGAVSNIALDAIFIAGLGMGVKGAALGTVIAQFLSVAFLMSYYFRGKSFVVLRRSSFAIVWKIVGEILAMGGPTLLLMSFAAISFIFMNRMLVIHGGDLAVSAWAILNRLINFTTLPGIAIGQGLQPVLGFNYGAKRYARALTSVKLAFGAAAVLGIAIFAALYLAPEFFVRFFTTEPELIEMSIYGARLAFSTVSITACLIVSIFFFQSLGKAKQAFIITLRPGVVLFPLTLILPAFFQLDGVFLAYPVTEVIGFVIAIIMLFPPIREFHKLRGSTRAGKAVG